MIEVDKDFSTSQTVVYAKAQSVLESFWYVLDSQTSLTILA